MALNNERNDNMKKNELTMKESDEAREMENE